MEYFRVGAALQQPLTVIVVDEQAGEREERCTGLMPELGIGAVIKQEPQRSVENVEQPWRLCGREAPDAGEGLGNLRRNNRAPVGEDTLKRVPADAVGEVGGVEIDHVVDAVLGRRVNDRVSLVAVRIDKGKAAASGEIGAH